MDISMGDIMEHGLKGVIIMVVIILITTIIKSEWFGNFLSKVGELFLEKIIKKRRTDVPIKNLSESSILNHDIFNYIDFWTYSKVPTLTFSSECKSAIFQSYLTIYLQSYKKVLFGFIENGDYKEMDESQLSTSFIKLINEIIKEYEKTAAANNIPPIIIQKMKVKNNETISLILKLIKNICSTKFYTSEKNFLKVYSILHIMLSILESTITNSEDICNSLNGEISGITFDGKTEP